MEDGIKQEWINKFIKDINEIKILLNKQYLDNWALTGSAAIVFLLYKYNLLKYYNLIPSDIDILTSSNDLLILKNLGKFNKVQNTLEKSATFLRSNISIDNVINQIDITITPTIKYITIDDINIINPKLILKDYEDYIKDPHRDIIKDQTKINILKRFINNIKLDYTNEKTIKSKKQNLRDNIEINNNTSQQLIDNISRKLFY